MSDPRPIEQKIIATADTRGAEQMSDALEEVKGKTTEASAADQQATAATNASRQADERAAQAKARKGDQHQRITQRLRDEIAAQMAHERQTRAGVEQGEAAQREAAQREQRITRLSRALAAQRDTQDELNRRVEHSITGQRSASRASDDLTASIGRQGDGAASAGSAVSGMMTRWLSFAAISGTLLAFLREINSTLDRQAKSAADLGEVLGGLAANVGGGLADELLTDVNQIALDRGLGLDGRRRLIEVLSASTDIDAGQSREQLASTAQRFANLERGTGQGGADAFNAVRALRVNFGLSEDDAINRASALFNAGLEPGLVESLTERGAPVGGEDFMALIMAARGQVNLRTQGRATQSIIESLTRRDQDGSLSADLQAAGLTGEENLVDRIATITRARDAGTISEAQFERAIGGAQNRRIFDPLSRALPGLEGARRELGQANVNEEIVRRLQSDIIRAQETEQRRQLQGQQAVEQFGLLPNAQTFNAAVTGVAEAGGGSFLLGATRPGVKGMIPIVGPVLGVRDALTVRGMAKDSIESMREFQSDQDRIAPRANQPATINNTTINITGPSYYRDDPLTSDFDVGRQQ